MRTLEVHMFARNVSFRLKPGRSAEFTQVFDKDVLPVLRKQKGFQDEIALVAPDGMDAIGISLWDTKENAETYARGSYAGVLKTLQPMIQGEVHVKTYDVSSSTFHKIAGHATA
jgi:heme-degrading monooxygenase HmoA